MPEDSLLLSPSVRELSVAREFSLNEIIVSVLLTALAAIYCRAVLIE
jgi:hypothetical protein